MKKAISLILSAMLMAILLAACGKDAPSTPAGGSGSGSAKPRTITWLTTRASWAAMDAIAEDYMAANPHITIEFERISDRSSFNQKVQILAASNSLPDLIDGVPAQLRQEIGDQGLVLDVDELYESLNYTDRMLPIGLEWARLPDGRLYEMAWENNVEYFWYNKNMFAAAGIEAPPETFDELLEVCEKLANAGNAAISVWPGWEISRWQSFIPYRLTGNDFLNGLLSGETTMSSDVGIQSATFLQELGTKYFQPGWSTTDYTGALETFLSGNAGIYYIGAWQFNSFLDENGEIKDEFGYFYLPTMDGATTTATDMFANAGTGTMLNAATFDEDVQAFVAYLLEEYPDKAFWEIGLLPAATFDTTKGEFSSFWQQVMDDCNSLTGYAYTWDVRFPAASAEVLSKEQINLGMGVITPQEFAERVDNSLAENIT